MVTDELIQVIVERIWAFFKTRAILRKKRFCLITGRALIRGGTNTILTRRVTELTNSRIVEISFWAGGEAPSFIKLYKIIHTD